MNAELRRRLEILAEQGDAEARALLHRLLKREGRSPCRFAHCASTQAGLSECLDQAIASGKYTWREYRDWDWREWQARATDPFLVEQRLWLLARNFEWHSSREFWLHRPCKVAVQPTDMGWRAMAHGYMTRNFFESAVEALAFMHRELAAGPLGTPFRSTAFAET